MCFEESRRSSLASLGDRLRNSRTGKTRAAWLDFPAQKGAPQIRPHRRQLETCF